MKLAFQIDKRDGRPAFEPLYTKNTFRLDTINMQKSSRFLCLPPELRLIIYELIFSPHPEHNTNPLSILLTCRKVNDEAVFMAMKMV
jgi:hypothetical protein